MGSKQRDYWSVIVNWSFSVILLYESTFHNQNCGQHNKVFVRNTKEQNLYGYGEDALPHDNGISCHNYCCCCKFSAFSFRQYNFVACQTIMPLTI